MSSSYVSIGADMCEQSVFYLLPGLNLEVDTFFVDRMIVSKISWSDFKLIEKLQFMDALDDVFLGVQNPMSPIGMIDLPDDVEDGNESPYFCIFLNSEDGDKSSEQKELRSHEQIADINRLSRAFWLLGDNTTLDPLEHISYKRDGFSVTRRPRLFGRQYIELENSNIVSSADLQQVAQVVPKLRVFDLGRDASNLKISEELFGQCFKASTSNNAYASFRLLNLYSGLKTLLGNRFWELERLSDKMEVDCSIILANRNAVAHGRNITDSRELEIDLRKILRLLICEGIARALEEPSLSFGEDLDLIGSYLSSSEQGLARISNATTLFRAVRRFADLNSMPLRSLSEWISEDHSGMKSAEEYSLLAHGPIAEAMKNLAKNEGEEPETELIVR